MNKAYSRLQPHYMRTSICFVVLKSTKAGEYGKRKHIDRDRESQTVVSALR